MGKITTYVATHAKAFTALAIGLLTTATYVWGPSNQWVVLGGTVLAAFGVGAVPNKKAPK